MTEWILHIDGDGFFAYCEIARFPHLRGKPVVVGEERGIVCASTYEAKNLGITRTMPIFMVREKFPQVTVLSSHFELYEHYSQKLKDLVAPSVNVLESYSIDECFGLVTFQDDAPKKELQKWLQTLKTRVQLSTGLTYSFGLARTKVLAKVASKLQKPDGCTVIMPLEEEAILKKTSIESIWGIGRSLTQQFWDMKIKTANEFREWKESRVVEKFSLPVRELWHELNGRRMFSVSDIRVLPKSLQSTKSFTPARSLKTFVIAELIQNIDVVFSRMRKYALLTNTVSIFLKTKEKRYYSTSVVLEKYTSNPLDVIDKIIEKANELFEDNVLYKSTGITVFNLLPHALVQEDLFGAQVKVKENEKVMRAVDMVRDKYGHESIGILGSMLSKIDRTQKGIIRRAKEQYVYGLPLAYLGEVD